MTKPAAITAQIVDMRNIGTQKSLRITLHIPQEEALKAIEAFGWPTSVDPVPVAIAMLDLKEVMSHTKARSGLHKPPPDSEAPLAPGRAPRSFHEMSYAEQAGLCCNNPAFRKFLGIHSHRGGLPGMEPKDVDSAAKLVRAFCRVTSRAHILPGTEAEVIWRGLVSDYRAWLHEPEMVP